MPDISASGNAPWTGKAHFYIHANDYRPGGPSGPTDSLADTTTCKRDITKFTGLGVNKIRIYVN